MSESRWDYLKELLKVPPKTKTPIQLTALYLVFLVSISVLYLTLITTIVNNQHCLILSAVGTSFFAFLALTTSLSFLKALRILVPERPSNLQTNDIVAVPFDMRIQGHLFKKIQKAFHDLGFSTHTKSVRSLHHKHTYRFSIAKKNHMSIGIVWLGSDFFKSTVMRKLPIPNSCEYIIDKIMKGEVSTILICSDVIAFPQEIIDEEVRLGRQRPSLHFVFFSKDYVAYINEADQTLVNNLLAQKLRDFVQQ